jgi:hypothetical protein
MVRNEWARDRRISYKARGLLTYLCSHAAGYRCSQAQMIADSDDGRAAIRSALAELEAAGYLHRERARTDAGRFGETDYVLADPFDAAGHLVAPGAETAPGRKSAPAYASDGAETAPELPGTRGDYPRREIAPLEDQGEKTKPLPLPLPLGSAEERTPTAAELFDQWWASYPKKVGKDAARRAWAKACRRTDPLKILDVIAHYPFREDRAYVKDPATWLNAGCWEDDLDAVAAAVAGSNGNGYGRRSSEPYQNPPPGSYSTGRTQF